MRNVIQYVVKYPWARSWSDQKEQEKQRATPVLKNIIEKDKL